MFLNVIFIIDKFVGDLFCSKRASEPFKFVNLVVCLLFKSTYIYPRVDFLVPPYVCIEVYMKETSARVGQFFGLQEWIIKRRKNRFIKTDLSRDWVDEVSFSLYKR